MNLNLTIQKYQGFQSAMRCQSYQLWYISAISVGIPQETSTHQQINFHHDQTKLVGRIKVSALQTTKKWGGNAYSSHALSVKQQRQLYWNVLCKSFQDIRAN